MTYFHAKHALAMEVAVARFAAGRAIAATCFGPQARFVQSKARLRVACCSRRAGKSRGVAAWLLEGALLLPGSVSLYLAITRKSAKRIIWRIFEELDREFHLGLEFRLGDLIIRVPNGSEIHVAGCPDAANVDTFRGTPYLRVAVDEGASFPPSYAGKLIDEALIPATVDLRGEVALIGTPGVAPVGYMWEASTGVIEGWERHHWTMLDNPHLPNAREEIEGIIRRRGWSWDHPTIRREYGGEWTADLSMLVYGSYTDKLLVDHGPRKEDGPWHYVLGLDFGTSEDRESMAYSVCAYSDTVSFAYVVETKGESGATPASVAATVQGFQGKYRSKLEAIVGDPGSLGKDFIQSLRTRYRIPVEPADKANKRGHIELLNGDMAHGLLRFVRQGTEGVVGEMKILPWSDDSRTHEKEKVPNHHCDATLYAWRRCRPYDAEPAPEPEPLPGTPEHSELREERIERAAVLAARTRKAKPWWRR